MDSLPEKQQEQARALAKQIDEKNMQAIISYGAGRAKATWGILPFDACSCAK